MQRITLTLVLLACLAFLPATSNAAWFSADDTLVSIDGTNYSTDDFKHWWMYWKEADSSLPDTPEPYINWLLLSREGARMDLDSDPNFNRQTRVFLQSRTLLKLKYEEVDGKINVTDADIRAYYDKNYTPTWLLVRLIFKDEATSATAWQELAEGVVTVDDLLGRDADAGGPDAIKEGWVRPDQIDPGWVEIFKKTAVGQVVNPDEYGNDAILYFLKEQKDGNEEELGRLRESIESKLWKEQEGAKTMALIFKLRDKYQVEIDKERLAALDINAADDSFTDAPMITTNRENVSEKQFIAVIRRLMDSRPTAAHAGADAEKAIDLKNETADNIIGQSVTNWESLDRHY
ncbi:MAG: peptidyl-prolyl cis-trans isomerase, partial [Desulfuromonadales bacterium]